MSEPLFRIEAIEHQKARLFGKVLLVQPASFKAITLSIVGVVFLIFVFLLFGTYSVKETVTGYVVPQKGVVKVYSSGVGNVREVFVEEGSLVSVNSPLVKVVNEHNANGQDVHKGSQDKLKNQIQNLKESQDDDEQKFVLSQAQLLEQKKYLDKELKASVEQIEVQNERLVQSQKKLDMFKTLEKQSYIEKFKVVEQTDEVLQLKSALAQLKAQNARIENQLAEINHNIAKMPIDKQSRLTEKNNQILELESNELKQFAQSEEMITSPIEGTVTSLQAHPGQSSSNAPLLTILPKDSTLYVNLFVPSRAIGFIKKGQAVKLRYDAYPYQRYGMYNGTIVSVSKTVLNPNEENDSFKLDAPHYRVKVALEKQTIDAFGESVLLTPGITVEADVVLDKQSIFSWILSPLKRFKG